MTSPNNTSKLNKTPYSDKMGYIDIGINLTNHQFNNKQCSPRKIISEALSENVVSMVLTGTSRKGSVDSVSICKKNSDIMPLYCTVGVHPHNAKHWDEKVRDELKGLAQTNKNSKDSPGCVVAIGECGLDFNRNFSDQKDQIKCFTDQLKMAQELDLPVFLHERDASDVFQDCIESVVKENNSIMIRGVVHCLTGSYNEIVSYLNQGLYVGFTGFICNPKRSIVTVDALQTIAGNSDLRGMFLNRVMVETDAPFMAPIKGLKSNHPKYISHVVRKLAEIFKMDSQEMMLITYSNTLQFFGISEVDRKINDQNKVLIDEPKQLNHKINHSVTVGDGVNKPLSYADILRRS